MGSAPNPIAATNCYSSSARPKRKQAGLGAWSTFVCPRTANRSLQKRSPSPCAATGYAKGHYRRQEVQDLIAITRVLADRRDTLVLGALLRGPLVWLTEEELQLAAKTRITR